MRSLGYNVALFVNEEAIVYKPTQVVKPNQKKLSDEQLIEMLQSNQELDDIAIARVTPISVKQQRQTKQTETERVSVQKQTEQKSDNQDVEMKQFELMDDDEMSADDDDEENGIWPISLGRL